jgi:hypothetical protein
MDLFKALKGGKNEQVDIFLICFDCGVRHIHNKGRH